MAPTDPAPRGLQRLGLRRRTDGSTVVRPGGALLLCVIVWAFCAATALQAFWLLGLDGWSFAVLPAVVCAVLWVLLWAPRVVVREDRIEVRNVLVTHHLPMAAIERARLGAMLRFEVRSQRADGAEEVVTAWNAPGVGRDRPRERLARADRRAPGASARAQADWAERLRRDQLASPSHAAVEAWERWEAGRAGVAGQERPAATRRLNVGVLVVLAGCALAVTVRALV
ncbi:PH domain-containing protein [Brachybacterium sp. YJGR34]|uniref:PH domain-containing protein n=1 Tax=Brachybacterium sp. YJGR34 TaxID=2059911 RepID=UPI00130089E7|nr:PH domain-containing protein [Brachybacterium sp. YJGR34]